MIFEDGNAVLIIVIQFGHLHPKVARLLIVENHIYAIKSCRIMHPLREVGPGLGDSELGRSQAEEAHKIEEAQFLLYKTCAPTAKACHLKLASNRSS